jgi:hypothetical protein
LIYKLTLSDHARIAPQLTVSLSVSLERFLACPLLLEEKVEKNYLGSNLLSEAFTVIIALYIPLKT